MRFRPCIDILNGKVVQIIGSTLDSTNQKTSTNYVSEKSHLWYVELYKKDNLTGGHIIALNKGNDDVVRECLASWEGAFQYGGGVNAENAKKYLDMGASHIIVTSFIFPEATFSLQRIKDLIKTVGKKRLVIDLSCRKKDENFYVVINKWQTFTDFKVTSENLKQLSNYCDEFLIHSVDMEGKKSGINTDLIKILAEALVIPITYAGGISSIEDLDLIKEAGKSKIDFTIGSSLDIFGGHIEYQSVLNWLKQKT